MYRAKLVTVEYSGKLTFKIYGAWRTPEQLAVMLERLTKGVISPYQCVNLKELSVKVVK